MAGVGARKEDADNSGQVGIECTISPVVLTFDCSSRFYHSLAEQQIRATTEHKLVFQFLFTERLMFISAA
jgi:hypothetical protein